MNIIYINWNCYGAEDLVKALHNMGHNIFVTQRGDKIDHCIDEEYIERLEGLIREQKAELVVTFNYFPSVSIACENTRCRYFAWIYDNPYLKMYDKTITNEMNYVGCFDSEMVNRLTQKGVDTVHYVPLAANVERMSGQYGVTDKYNDDIVFVGSLYNEKHNFYERLLSKTKDMELAGYLDGVMAAQKLVYGYNFLEECITDEVFEKIRSVMPYNLEEGSYATEKSVYADYYLSPRITYLERTELLDRLSGYYNVGLYTYNEEFKLGNVKNRGVLDYYNEMPGLFHNARINLNISLKSIKSGVPLRAMDILGAGGFLMTNYQADLFRHFEPDVHFTYYSSVEEALDKAGYYLQHEDERLRIADNALKLMEKEHTYEVRLENVLRDIYA